MKIKLLVGVLLLSIGSFAQRKNDGWAIQSHYGIMEGKGQMSNYASTASIGVNFFPGSRGYLVESNLMIHDYFVDKDNLNLPYKLYGLNVMGGWSYENLSPFFLNLKAGAFVGIERINNGKDRDNLYGILLPIDVTKFTYGAVISPEAEIVIWKRLTGLLCFSQYWNIKSEVSEWKYSVELGIKWYLN